MKDIYDASFSDIAESARKIQDWLNVLRVRYENTRFQRYLTRLEEIQSHSKSGKLELLNDNSGQYFDSLYEFSDLDYVRLVFADDEPDGLLEILEKIIKGPDDTRAENSGNARARDFSFEAITGARIAASGMKVTFDETGDIVADFPLGRMYIQCKRPSSNSAIKRRAKDAAKQLKIDLSISSSGASYGLIAIDATKIINPKLLPFVVPTRELSDFHHMDILSKFCDAQIDPLIEGGELLRHENIIGVMVRFAGQWKIQNTGTILYQHDVLTNYFTPQNNKRLEVIKSFADAMQQRAPKFKVV